MTNVYFKHSTEFIMAIIFEMKRGNLPSMVKKKSFEIFCVKPSSFAFKSLQLHSSLLQFVNIKSDFHIWFSTTFLGHQNKKIQKTRVEQPPCYFPATETTKRPSASLFWVKLGCRVREPETTNCPERQTVPNP